MKHVRRFADYDGYSQSVRLRSIIVTVVACHVRGGMVAIFKTQNPAMEGPEQLERVGRPKDNVDRWRSFAAHRSLGAIGPLSTN